MNKNFKTYATALALGAAVISGTNNFLTKLAVTAVKDPIIYTTLKNLIVALFLAGAIIAWKKWPEIKSLDKNRLWKLLAIGIIGGSIPFALYFTGLSKTTAVNASLIHKTLFLWVAIFALPILKERLAPWQWLGITAIFGANLMIGGFTGFKFNAGEFMILTATILWAIENIIAKKALRDISSLTVAGARMILGSLLLLLLVFWQGGGEIVYQLNSQQWLWALLTSALLFGYVICWYTALKHAPATYVATLLVPATLITNLLSAIFITKSMQFSQIISGVLFAAGAALVIYFAKETAKKTEAEETSLTQNA